jgi:hypothetical protein
MRRKLALLAAATFVAVGASLAAAGPAAAAPGGTPGPAQAAIEHASGTSVLFYCTTDPDPAHPGQHLGWKKPTQPSPQRNVGGACPALP